MDIIGRGYDGFLTEIKIKHYVSSQEGKITPYHGHKTAAFKTDIEGWKETSKTKIAFSPKEWKPVP